MELVFHQQKTLSIRGAGAVMNDGCNGPPVPMASNLHTCITGAPNHCWRRDVGGGSGQWVGRGNNVVFLRGGEEAGVFVWERREWI